MRYSVIHWFQGAWISIPLFLFTGMPDLTLYIRIFNVLKTCNGNNQITIINNNHQSNNNNHQNHHHHHSVSSSVANSYTFLTIQNTLVHISAWNDGIVFAVMSVLCVRSHHRPMLQNRQL